jgi:hypothetical protein
MDLKEEGVEDEIQEQLSVCLSDIGASVVVRPHERTGH